MASVYFDEATRIHKGGARPSVDALTLDIQDGEFLVLVGPVGVRQVHHCGCSRVWSR